MKFKGDIIITDPCYIMRAEHHGTIPLTDDDWQTCDYGQNMQVFGFKNYLTKDTIYGDWSCTAYDSDTNEPIGEFCADAGLVSVCLLEDVLKYNPDFDYHINKPYTTTLIKNFHGEVDFEIVDVEFEDEDGEACNDQEVRVVGKGNINFFTSQTGISIKELLI